MGTAYIVFVVVFIVVIALFAYLDAKKGLRESLPLFLKIFVPMLLTGVIVKIPELLKVIGKDDIVAYIIGGIGVVIFYAVMFNMFKSEKSTRKKGVMDYFMGFLIGLSRGWLYAGFVVLYVDKIFTLSFLQPALRAAIENPVKWILFLSFF